MNMNNIHVVYYENHNGGFDATVKGARQIRAKDSIDLCEARTFIRILFREEIGPCKIVKEEINYYEGL